MSLAELAPGAFGSTSVDKPDLQAAIDATLADNECSHGWLAHERDRHTCDCWNPCHVREERPRYVKYDPTHTPGDPMLSLNTARDYVADRTETNVTNLMRAFSITKIEAAEKLVTLESEGLVRRRLGRGPAVYITVKADAPTADHPPAPASGFRERMIAEGEAELARLDAEVAEREERRRALSNEEAELRTERERITETLELLGYVDDRARA